MRLLLLGLLPVRGDRFPGSPEQFRLVNAELRQLATSIGVEFFDWGERLAMMSDPDELFYRDGFHPNKGGPSRSAEYYGNIWLR